MGRRAPDGEPGSEMLASANECLHPVSGESSPGYPGQVCCDTIVCHGSWSARFKRQWASRKLFSSACLSRDQSSAGFDQIFLAPVKLAQMRLKTLQLGSLYNCLESDSSTLEFQFRYTRDGIPLRRTWSPEIRLLKGSSRKRRDRCSVREPDGSTTSSDGGGLCTNLWSKFLMIKMCM